MSIILVIFYFILIPLAVFKIIKNSNSLLNKKMYKYNASSDFN